MSFVVPLVLSVLLAAGGPVPGVPGPPGGSLDTELTRIAQERAQAETKKMLAEMERDTSLPEATKKEVRSKVSRLKIAIYTTSNKLEDVVGAYAKVIPGASFVFAERNILADVYDIAKEQGVTVPPETDKTWQGKSLRYARWTQEDQSLQIAVEDHLIDPRTAKVSHQTVVMVTSVGR